MCLCMMPSWKRASVATLPSLCVSSVLSTTISAGWTPRQTPAKSKMNFRYEQIPGSVTILVSLGCYTNFHRLGGLNDRHLFITFLEAEKSNIKLPVNPVSGEGSLPDLQIAVFSLHIHVVESRSSKLSHFFFFYFL